MLYYLTYHVLCRQKRPKNK